MTGLQNKRTLIVIAGPTAVGKTSLAIETAQHFQTDIVSCDSRQLFNELKVGVARPSETELNAVKHHFIASHSIFNDYNAGDYELEVNTLLNELFAKHEVVVMTGGTGLYIKAAIEGLDPLPPKDEKLRNELQSLFDTLGIEALQEKAKALSIELQGENNSNPQRLIRAIEIELHKSNMPKRTAIARNYQAKCFYIDRPREELYQRINSRVDTMMTEGLEEEARQLHENKSLNALQTVGYKELFEYFDGHWTKEKAVEKIKQNTRNYAKRQLTWFRNQGSFRRINANLSELLNQLET